MRKIKPFLVPFAASLLLSASALNVNAEALTPDAVPPACSQLLMQPYANGDFNSWGLFVGDKWVQVAGTSVDLTTREAVAKLQADNFCQPNIAPIQYASEIPETPETSEMSETPQDAETPAEIPSQPLSSGTSHVSEQTQKYLNFGLGVLVLFLIGWLVWLQIKPLERWAKRQQRPDNPVPKYWEN